MGLRTDREPYPGRLKTEHDAVRCREPVRAPAGEHDRMDPLDDRRWIQEVGLSSSRATATYVNASDSAVARATTTVVPVSQPSLSAVWCPISKPSITRSFCRPTCQPHEGPLPAVTLTSRVK